MGKILEVSVSKDIRSISFIDKRVIKLLLNGREGYYLGGTMAT